MAKGPEGNVKSNIKKILTRYNVYFFMPVQSGYGATGLDFHCVVYINLFGTEVALAFFIEAKEEGKEPTARQDLFLKNRWEQQKAKTFVIDGPKGYAELETWLSKLQTLTAQGLLSGQRTLD
jgi:hypothetical protein